MSVKYPLLAPASIAPVMILLNLLEQNPDLMIVDRPAYKGDALRLANALANHGRYLSLGGQSETFEEDGDGESFNMGGISDVLSLDINESLFAGESWETVLAQTEIIYSSLMKLRERVQKSNKADPNKVMNFYKNLGTLLEKIISLRERGTEAKEIHDFRNRVLAVLDNVLTSEQRTLAIQYMEELTPLPPKQPEMLQIADISTKNPFILTNID